MNATTAKAAISRMIERHGVSAVKEDGSTIRGMMSPLRDTPRADYDPEGSRNLEATPRYAFRCIDPIETTDAIIIGAGTPAATTYYVEMVTPVLFDNQIVSYTAVILVRL